MNKRLVGILVFCLALLFSLGACAEALQENGFYYYFNERNEAVISGYGGEKTSIVVPSEIAGRKVTTLDYDCFAGRDDLTSIKLPDTLRTIGWNAFAACRSLTSIEIPTGVTDIGRHAFSGCTSLRRISLPDTLVNLRRYAFNGCTSLREITIPANVIEIGGNTFDGCASLSKITVMGHDTTFTDLNRFIALERYFNCSVYCWEDSYIAGRFLRYGDDFDVHYLEPENLDTFTQIQTVGTPVDPETVTEQNLPSYVPKTPVTAPKLMLDSDVKVTDANGKPVQISHLGHEVHKPKDASGNVFLYDLFVVDSNNNRVAVKFDKPQPLFLPFLPGMNYHAVMQHDVTLNHYYMGDYNGPYHAYNVMDGSLFRTQGGFLIYTTSFSPFEIIVEEDAADPSVLPQTGDNSPSLMLLAALLAFCVCSGLMLKRRAA